MQQNLDHPNNHTAEGDQLYGKPESFFAASNYDRIDVPAQAQVKNFSNQHEKEDHYACNLEVVEEVHMKLRHQFFVTPSLQALVGSTHSIRTNLTFDFGFKSVPFITRKNTHRKHLIMFAITASHSSSELPTDHQLSASEQ